MIQMERMRRGAATPSRTQQALDWLAAEPDRTMSAAAKEFGINPSAVQRGLRRRQVAAQRCTCPHCGKSLA